MNARQKMLEGLFIPAHPLALDRNRQLDERRQRALTRYYIAAGAGGLAVGVHTTQFAIHDAKVGLLEPVLSIAADEVGNKPVLKIAGVCGIRKQAVSETDLAAKLGYDAVLVSFTDLREAAISELIEHARVIAEVLPIVGFYLQPSVGGRTLPFTFWRQLLEIENLIAIKVAPFNRYQTLDVVRAVAESGRSDEVALYTGNDDNIVNDLLTTFEFGGRKVRFRGGLLGHWAVWTKPARAYFDQATKIASAKLLTLGTQVTDANSALFDVANSFQGCIAGLHEILRRQGLLEGRWCLDPDEDLSPGQAEEIDRVCKQYPHLTDDDFVRQHLDAWLR